MTHGRARIAAAAATLLLAGGLIAGCGGSDDGTSAGADTAAEASTVAALSLADYQAQATEICTASDEAQAKLAEPTTPEEALTFLDEQAAIGTAYVTDLEGIAPPAEYAEDHAALVNAGKLGLALVDDAKTAVEGGETLEAALTTIADSEGYAAANAQQETAATALDLPACAPDA